MSQFDTCPAERTPQQPRGGVLQRLLAADPADCGVDAFDVTVADLIRTAGSDAD